MSETSSWKSEKLCREQWAGWQSLQLKVEVGLQRAKKKRNSGLHQEFFPDSFFLKGLERDLRLSFSLPWGLGLGLALGLGLGNTERQNLELQVQWDWKRDTRKKVSCTKNTSWQLLPLGYRRGFSTKPQVTWSQGLSIAIGRETKSKVVDAAGLQGSCKRRIRLHQEFSPTTSGSWLVLGLKSQPTAKFRIRFRVRTETNPRIPGGVGLQRVY